MKVNSPVSLSNEPVDCAAPSQVSLHEIGKKLRDHYWALAQRIDAMKLDEVMRLPMVGNPNRKWYWDRGRLNNYNVRVLTEGKWYVIIRTR